MLLCQQRRVVLFLERGYMQDRFVLIRPIREAVELFHDRQMAAVERAAERQQIQRKLSEMDLLPGA